MGNIRMYYDKEVHIHEVTKKIDNESSLRNRLRHQALCAWGHVF